MRILVDENIPNITVHELRALGHDVLDIRGIERQGMLDDELWPFAQTERRMLVTTDKVSPSTAMSSIAASWWCVCSNRTSSGFTHGLWLFSGSSLSTTGPGLVSSCAMRCRVFTERERKTNVAWAQV